MELTESGKDAADALARAREKMNSAAIATIGMQNLCEILGLTVRRLSANSKKGLTEDFCFLIAPGVYEVWRDGVYWPQDTRGNSVEACPSRERCETKLKPAVNIPVTEQAEGFWRGLRTTDA